MFISTVHMANTDSGLSAINMAGLRKIVVLAGENGSGKSRLLQEVFRSRLRANSNLKVPNGETRIQGGTVSVGSKSRFNPIPFVPTSCVCLDPRKMDKTILKNKSEESAALGMGEMDGSLAYIQLLRNRHWNVTHQDSTVEEELAEKHRRAFETLSELIESVLGARLGDNVDGDSEFFGRSIAEATLSSGQMALLIWCVALHSQEGQLGNSVLLMDEPENHLHAESLIATVNRIFAANRDGQLWIATHSVPLIAALYRTHPNHLSLYFMENGTPHYASERPEKVLTSLIGGEHNVEALREFVDLPEVFATNRYAAECLLDAEVVAGDNPHDPQTGIVSEATEELDVTRLLDVGCGKGRLLASLSAKHGDDLPNRIDYVAWDVSDSHKCECENEIRKVYDDSKPRWFKDMPALRADWTSNQFDCVVLCNVLHEIPPCDWVRTFGRTNVISDSLKDAGHVLIIEDYLMPKGEYAHPFGFIVLDTDALQKLFCAGTGADEIRVHNERDGRIKGHVIPKHLLLNVSDESTKEALNFARSNADKKVREIRTSGKSDFKAGRAHGFWIQQYANTSLALS